MPATSQFPAKRRHLLGESRTIGVNRFGKNRPQLAREGDALPGPARFQAAHRCVVDVPDYDLGHIGLPRR